MPREAVTHHEITDEDIARQIMETIAWDSRVHYPHIRVTVDSGVVFLGGVVERLVEKTATEEDASRIAGVTDVVSNIVVQPEKPVTSGEIAEGVRRALRRDVRLKGEDFEVEVANGVVTLRGEVVSAMEKWAALDTARLTYGVTDLIDQVTILPTEPTDGHMLEELVGAALKRVGHLDTRRIHAHVENTFVTLTGTADFLHQRLAAENAVSDVPGVSGVRNEIRVGR